MKAILILLTGLLAIGAHAADITRGATFSDGQRLTAADLHALVDSAVINPDFISGKSAASSLAGGDLLLMYSGSALYKISVNAALYQNTAIITGLSAKTAPAAADYFLLYDAAGTALKKVTLDNLTWNNFLVYSNLYRNFPYTAVLTNLTPESLPFNIEYLLGSESFAPNRRITPHNLLFGWPGIVDYNNLTANSTIPLYVPSGFEAGNTTVSLQNLASYLAVDGFLFGGTKFQSFDYPLGSGLVVNTNHHLLSKPQFSRWVLVCQTNDNGFVVEDEVGQENFYNAATGLKIFSAGANSTNVFISQISATTPSTRNKTTGADGTIVAVRWKLRNYSEQHY